MENEKDRQQYDDTVLRGLVSIWEVFKKVNDNKQNDCNSSRMYRDGGENGRKTMITIKTILVAVFVFCTGLVPLLLDSPEIARGYQLIFEREFDGNIVISDKRYLDKNITHSCYIDKAIKTVGRHKDTAATTENWVLADGVVPTHRRRMAKIVYSPYRWSVFPFPIILHTATVIQEHLKNPLLRISVK